MATVGFVCLKVTFHAEIAVMFVKFNSTFFTPRTLYKYAPYQEQPQLDRKPEELSKVTRDNVLRMYSVPCMYSSQGPLVVLYCNRRLSINSFLLIP